MKRALLALCFACACIGPVRGGLPPLVNGCQKDADCPFPWICADGGCEDWQCHSSCDCPPPAENFGCEFDSEGLGFCVAGKTPSFPCTLPDGGAGLCPSGACDGGTP